MLVAAADELILVLWLGPVSGSLSSNTTLHGLELLPQSALAAMKDEDGKRETKTHAYFWSADGDLGFWNNRKYKPQPPPPSHTLLTGDASTDSGASKARKFASNSRTSVRVDGVPGRLVVVGPRRPVRLWAEERDEGSGSRNELLDVTLDQRTAIAFVVVLTTNKY